MWSVKPYFLNSSWNSKIFDNCSGFEDTPLGMQLTPTGVEGLDAILGGFPEKSLILLAGNPGTGKTIFSAQFLYRGCMDYGENGVYVSLAESRETFYENMKAFGFDFEKFEKKRAFRYLDLLTVKEPAVPQILNTIIEEVGKTKAKRLVLDSYSALAQAFKDPMDARIVAHTILGKLIRMMGCTTILIEEIPYGESRIGFGVEEFVADAVLRLSIDELAGYRLRRLELLKLRGVRIKEPKLVFTLDREFKVFQPFRLNLPKNPKRFKPIPDSTDKYSTGSKSLDEALDGGLPKGSVTLLEMDEKITKPMHHLIVNTIGTNFTVQGKPVFIVPSIGTDLSTLYQAFIKLYGGTMTEWTSCTKVIFGESFTPVEDSPVVISVKGEDWREDIDKVLAASRELTAKTGKPSLCILGLDTLVNLYGEKQCVEILNLSAADARKAGAAILILVKPGFAELAIKLSPIADVHLRLTRKHGCLMLYGVKPRTGLYAVDADTSKGYPVPKLTPIL